MAKRKDKTLTSKQQRELAEAPLQAQITQEQQELAEALWGSKGTPERLAEKFKRMEEEIKTLRQQNEDYNHALNDVENVEMYVLRFNKTVTAIHQMADACLAVERKLRRLKPIRVSKG